MIHAYLGIGSNLGDVLANLAAALEAVVAMPQTELVAVSQAYESEPWGVAAQERFANAVAHIRTNLTADQLLAYLKDIEEEMGRKPTTRFGPRVIDLDILLYGDEEWDSEELTIPHPRMSRREFVVRPLIEIDPDVAYPDGTPVSMGADEATQGPILAALGPIPGWEEATVYPTLLQGSGGTPPEARADLGPEDFRPVTPSADWRVPGRPEVFRSPRGEQWVPLGVARLDPSPSVPELIFYEAVLKEGGVPCEFYPNRPGEGYQGPYNVPRYVDLYVPASREREARELIREAAAAPPAEEE